MAGAGYKLFNTGDVLTAAQVNTYLMEQTVMVFADAAARTTALTGVVSEGMISYLKDTNAVEVYNGSAWVASDDPNAIQNTIVDAKGDLITATAADTPARLAVGSNGDTLVADSSTSTGLRWQGSTAAGKNRIINGAMDIWQRGTSVAANASSTYQTADRWYNTLNANTVAWAQETSIVPTGFQYSYKATAGTGGSQPWFLQAIESANCQDLAGKTVTLSAYCATSDSSSVDFIINWSSGFNEPLSGSWTALATQTVTTTATMPTTPQARQFSIPSNAKSLRVTIRTTNNLPASGTFCLTGVQLELGSVATAFSRAGGTLQGELAACQRYYWRAGGSAAFQYFGQGTAASSTVAYVNVQNPVVMRTTPSSVDYSTLSIFDGTGTYTATNVAFNVAAPYVSNLTVTISGATANRPALLNANNSTSAYLGFSAEL